MPGDDDENASIQAGISEPEQGGALAAINALPQIQEREKDQTYAALRGQLIFVPLVLKAEGYIKVRAVIGEQIYRLGVLHVSAVPQQSQQA